jgi:hypothetical protein
MRLLVYGFGDRRNEIPFPAGASPQRPDRLWGPPDLLSNRHGGCGRGVSYETQKRKVVFLCSILNVQSIQCASKRLHSGYTNARGETPDTLMLVVKLRYGNARIIEMPYAMFRKHLSISHSYKVCLTTQLTGSLRHFKTTFTACLEFYWEEFRTSVSGSFMACRSAPAPTSGY